MVGLQIFANWKKAIVSKSPMAQPRRHHEVLRLALRQVAQQSHSTVLIIRIFVIEFILTQPPVELQGNKDR
jgi:hypothetical protein